MAQIEGRIEKRSATINRVVVRISRLPYVPIVTLQPGYLSFKLL